jgi:hypothetical protein
MVQKVANPYHLSSLFNLLIVASPSIKIIVLKILQHIIQIQIPFEVFEEAVSVMARNKNSYAYKIVYETKVETKFEKSLFIKFMFNYLYCLRSKMWSSSDVESEGLYAVSQTLSATIREISSVCSLGSGKK